MHLVTRNVNTAFKELVQFFKDGQDGKTETFYRGINPIVRRDSRNGPVLMVDEPVMVTYTHPTERVLFNPARDANPFLHVYESLWMLAGRDDVAPLAYYAKNMANYSDDGRTLNGAYGRRWRSAKVQDGNREHDTEYVDQLDQLVDHLKADTNSRRAVLQMWNVEDDLMKIGGHECTWCADGGRESCLNCGQTGLSKGSKDVCCNTAVYFSIRERHTELDSGGVTPWMQPVSVPVVDRYLDMTVTNRSNDMIWGMLGGDYTTFSFLQEYMAARLGVEVGRYTQMTNNLHAYESNWKPEEWLSTSSVPVPIISKTVPLVKSPEAFDREVARFVEQCGGEEWRKPLVADEHGVNVAQRQDYTEPFLRDVAWPMMLAHRAHKYKGVDVHGINAFIGVCLANIEDAHWQIACINWFNKRRDRRGDTAKV